MLKLSDPVDAVSGIGSSYKRLLGKMGIFTVEDFLYHFPFRYDDFSQVTKIKDLQDGDLVTIRGTLEKIDNIYTRYGKRLTKGIVNDGSGKLELIWFNSHYLKKTLKTQLKYNFSGKVKKYNSKMTLMAPSFEKAGEDNVNTGRLVPIYPETDGLSSRWIRGKIQEALNSTGNLDEFLPAKIIQKEDFLEFEKALNTFHFPDSHQDSEKAKDRFKLEELLIELIKVEERKSNWAKKLTSFVIKKSSHQQKVEKLIKRLPFKLTDTQQKAVENITNDINRSHPMNRLLEGDVGTGKTIVAVIASYLTYLNGYNVLYMAPTEILAKQHYSTFQKFLENLDVNLKLLTSSSPKKPTKKPYICIGTHALLFKKEYEKVGLVVIDEQHRFGVEQRTQLTKVNKNDVTPHLLTMTATPIPRTLALTVYGDLKISQLLQIPNKKKDIETKVIPEKQRDEVFEWIRRSGQQTFVVCPFIQESFHEDFGHVKAVTAEYDKLKMGVFKNVKMGLLHGKLKSDEKREVVEKFERGEIQVLVSTPVIEVGIDIPDAAIMVIESGDRYGLASLHQLRGRVGRGDKKGYCFVFVGSNSRQAYKRLKYLEEFDNGLELAEIDMEMRGHGDLYGTMQHGFKRFKVARISDIETLEKAKKYAEEFFPVIGDYPKLLEKIYRVAGRHVGNN